MREPATMMWTAIQAAKRASDLVEEAAKATNPDDGAHLRNNAECCLNFAYRLHERACGLMRRKMH